MRAQNPVIKCDFCGKIIEASEAKPFVVGEHKAEDSCEKCRDRFNALVANIANPPKRAPRKAKDALASDVADPTR